MSQVTCRIDPSGQRFFYHYDAERNLIGLTNEKGERYQLKYDFNERLTEEIGFDGRVQTYRYDPAGYLIAHQEGQNRITQFRRDPLGQLLEKSSLEGDKSEYAYDARGYLVAAVNAHRQVKLAYDELGNLTEEHQDQQVIKHTYDALGRRIRSLLPDQKIVDYAYDGEGRYYRIQLNGQTLTHLERDALGRETDRHQGSVKSHFDYDPMGRLQRHRVIKDQTQLPLIQRNYQYDPAGNLTLIDDLRKGKTQFQYDALDRLSQVTGAHNELFAFDPAGNLLAHNQTQAGYSAGHRLRFFGDRHFEYDEAGNLIREKRGKEGRLVTEYQYNAENQLIQVTKNGQTFQYQYDALGRRISKRDAFGKTEFLWNSDVLLSETRQQLQKVYLYEPGSFKPLALVQDDQVYHYHLDHLGTPQEMTNTNGKVVWNVRYRAYGNVVHKEVEEVENNLRFQGQYFDAETGLHYNRFRYYDPQSGRFIHQDPIGLYGGTNNYEYVPNPTEWIDPLGLQAKDCFPQRIKLRENPRTGEKSLVQEPKGGKDFNFANNAEREFAQRILTEKSNLHVHRPGKKDYAGDFILIDRSNPKQPVAYVAEHKMPGGTGSAGLQASNAVKAANVIDPRIGRNVRVIKGNTNELINQITGRGSFKPNI